jgi:Ca2+-binding EF-hand superfamily protein
VLFRVLDLDRSGGLSRDELTTLLAPHGMLSKLDLDEDERISARELLLAGRFATEPLTASSRGTPPADRPADDDQSAVGASNITPIDAPRPLVRALLERYDDDRDGLLSAEELGLAPAVLASFDQDENGRLDEAEAAQFLRRPTLSAVLACTWSGAERSVVVVERPGEDAPAEAIGESASEPTDDAERDSSIVLAGQSVHVSLGPQAAALGRDASAALLAHCDGDGNGYLDRTEADIFPFARRTFPFMDADGDGKVPEDEFVEYARRAALVTTRQLVLTFQTQPRNVFEAIDADRDGRLSLTEVNAFAAKVPQWDADRNDALTPGELSAVARLTIGPRNTWLHPATPAPQSTLASGGRSTGLPRWFTAMDRNRDAVVSRREFLGPPRYFEKLDADRNGLLNAAEAQPSTTPEN